MLASYLIDDIALLGTDDNVGGAEENPPGSAVGGDDSTEPTTELVVIR